MQFRLFWSETLPCHIVWSAASSHNFHVWSNFPSGKKVAFPACEPEPQTVDIWEAEQIWASYCEREGWHRKGPTHSRSSSSLLGLRCLRSARKHHAAVHRAQCSFVPLRGRDSEGTGLGETCSCWPQQQCQGHSLSPCWLLSPNRALRGSIAARTQRARQWDTAWKLPFHDQPLPKCHCKAVVLHLCWHDSRHFMLVVKLYRVSLGGVEILDFCHVLPYTSETGEMLILSGYTLSETIMSQAPALHALNKCWGRGELYYRLTKILNEYSMSCTLNLHLSYYAE